MPSTARAGDMWNAAVDVVTGFVNFEINKHEARLRMAAAKAAPSSSVSPSKSAARFTDAATEAKETPRSYISRSSAFSVSYEATSSSASGTKNVVEETVDHIVCAGIANADAKDVATHLAASIWQNAQLGAKSEIEASACGSVVSGASGDKGTEPSSINDVSRMTSYGSAAIAKAAVDSIMQAGLLQELVSAESATGSKQISSSATSELAALAKAAVNGIVTSGLENDGRVASIYNSSSATSVLAAVTDLVTLPVVKAQSSSADIYHGDSSAAGTATVAKEAVDSIFDAGVAELAADQKSGSGQSADLNHSVVPATILTTDVSGTLAIAEEAAEFVIAAGVAELVTAEAVLAAAESSETAKIIAAAEAELAQVTAATATEEPPRFTASFADIQAPFAAYYRKHFSGCPTIAWKTIHGRFAPKAQQTTSATDAVPKVTAPAAEVEDLEWESIQGEIERAFISNERLRAQNEVLRLELEQLLSLQTPDETPR
jgi:hypothetical protein